jgi:Tol biopolymer transport system component
MRRASILFVLASVVALVPVHDASAAPAGRLVYSDVFGRSGLYTSATDGSDRVHVVNGAVYRSKWSPDGATIGFIVSRPHKIDRIDGVDPDGSNRRVLISRSRLPAAWNRITGYAWSPDGTQLAVCSTDKSYVHPRTYLVDLNDAGVTLVARRTCVEDWSATGSLLVKRGSNLLVMQADGTVVQRVLHGMHAGDAEFSPDATEVAFMCRNLIHGDICVIGVDGTGLVNLTTSGHVEWSPSWSPDGRWIVWSRSKSLDAGEDFGDLWRMRADGTRKTRLTRTKQIDEYEPDWIAPVT